MDRKSNQPFFQTKEWRVTTDVEQWWKSVNNSLIIFLTSIGLLFNSYRILTFITDLLFTNFWTMKMWNACTYSVKATINSMSPLHHQQKWLTKLSFFWKTPKGASPKKTSVSFWDFFNCFTKKLTASFFSYNTIINRHFNLIDSGNFLFTRLVHNKHTRKYKVLNLQCTNTIAAMVSITHVQYTLISWYVIYHIDIGIYMYIIGIMQRYLRIAGHGHLDRCFISNK